MIGVTQNAVSQWINGNRRPRPIFEKRIKEITKGKVTANDFYDLPELGKTIQ